MEHGTILDRIINENTTDILEEKLRLDFTKKIEKPPTLISIIDQEGNDCEICTTGNFSMITGKAKSRKSFFLSSVVVSAIRGDCTLSNMKGSEDCKPFAIMFDTEMSEYHSSRMGLAAIRQLPGELREHYLHFTLRELTPKERLNFIEEIIKKYHRETSIVVIDGVKDLLTQGINDEPESIELTTKLMKMTSEYNIHIICVLHQNKNDKNPRGHIGSELSNKAETVIEVQKDPKNTNASIITPLFTRGLDFEPFAFELDKENFAPVCVDFVKPKTKTEEKMEGMFCDIFTHKNHYTYSSLVNAISETTGKTPAAAKKNISSGIRNGIILKKDTHYTLGIINTDNFFNDNQPPF